MQQSSLDAMARDSYTRSQAMQDSLNSQASDARSQYNQSYGAANQSQADLSNFTKSMQSGMDMYNQALQGANQNAGYDVNNLNQAQNQVSQIQGIMGGLPRAVQAQNANYGATAGDVAGQYSTQAANLNQSLGLANQNAANQIQKMQGGLTGAQNATTAGLQGQQAKLTGYQAAAQNAAGIMQQAQLAMNTIETLAQQQGTITASQQAAYGQAKQAYANATAAYAQANLYSAQARNQNQITDFNQQTHDADLAKELATKSAVSHAPAAINGVMANQKAQPQNGFNINSLLNFNPLGMWG